MREEILSLLRPLRGLCDCSNSHVSGLGAHDPTCTGERAARAVAAIERDLLTIEELA